MKLSTKPFGISAFMLTISGWCAYGATVQTSGTGIELWFSITSGFSFIAAFLFLVGAASTIED